MGSVILFLMRGIAWGYFLLPRVAQRLCAHSLGFVLRLLKVRSKVVWQNLHLAFPGDGEVSQAKRQEVFEGFYRHFGFLVFELFLLFGPLRRFVTQRCELRGVENWREALKKGKGIVLFTSHLGNWEVMAAAGGVLIEGWNPMMVTKLLQPSWFHRAIEEGRRGCNVFGTYEPRTMRDIFAVLKRNGTVGVVMDQYAGPPVGVRVPFFGVPVGTNALLATLVKRTGAVLLHVSNRRLPDGRFVIQVDPPFPWVEHENADMEIALNTAAVVTQLEADIRAIPEQWLWMHRRFKGDLSPLRPGEWASPRARR